MITTSLRFVVHLTSIFIKLSTSTFIKLSISNRAFIEEYAIDPARRTSRSSTAQGLPGLPHRPTDNVALLHIFPRAASYLMLVRAVEIAPKYFNRSDRKGNFIRQSCVHVPLVSGTIFHQLTAQKKWPCIDNSDYSILAGNTAHHRCKLIPSPSL